MDGCEKVKHHIQAIGQRPEILIVLLATCGFILNVQQGYDTNGILRNDPLVFKGIRILTILAAESYAIWIVLKRRISWNFLLAGPMLPMVLYFCACLLSVPFSAYPMLSLFKAFEICMVILLCLLGLVSSAGKSSDLFNLNIKIVLLYNIIIWIESFVFPSLAWVKIRGETPFFGYALSGVFPVINGNMVGLFGAVLFMAFLPGIFKPGISRLRAFFPALIGLASTVFSYSRSSLLGLCIATALSLVLMKKYAILLILIFCLVMLGTSEKIRILIVDHLARGQEDRSLNSLSSNRIEMWNYVFSEYHNTIFGRGFAAGFRYDDSLYDGHAHNSVVELYFDVGLLGVVTWLFLIGSVFYYLYYLLISHAEIDYQLISIVGVMIFLLFKAFASTVFVHLDQSMFILAGIIVYSFRRLGVTEYAIFSTERNQNFSFSG